MVFIHSVFELKAGTEGVAHAAAFLLRTVREGRCTAHLEGRCCRGHNCQRWRFRPRPTSADGLMKSHRFHAVSLPIWLQISKTHTARAFPRVLEKALNDLAPLAVCALQTVLPAGARRCRGARPGLPRRGRTGSLLRVHSPH